ncbi:Uncharacterised protein [Listeria ivanovii subsp. londoniensis]|nr:Uncharacterised protein [Listeria ivanovii subsp. londoniensis]
MNRPQKSNFWRSVFFVAKHNYPDYLVVNYFNISGSMYQFFDILILV